MSRTDLQVPFSEKDEAKSLGARWDASNKTWYVPENIDLSKFQKWMPPAFEPNIVASSYFIAQNTKSCWKCNQSTRIYGFLLPSGHRTKDYIEHDDGTDEEVWSVSSEQTILSYITTLPREVESRVAKISRHYKPDFSKTTQSAYWMNHCEKCGMKQGDFNIFDEPQGGFLFLYPEEAKSVILYHITEPFEAECGGYSYDVEFFKYMQQQPFQQ